MYSYKYKLKNCIHMDECTCIYVYIISVVRFGFPVVLKANNSLIYTGIYKYICI